MHTSGLINTFSDNYTLCALSQVLGKSPTPVRPRRARRVVKSGAAKILCLITNNGLRMVIVGAVLGLGSALAVSRILKALLFQVSMHDRLTFVAVPVL